MHLFLIYFYIHLFFYPNYFGYIILYKLKSDIIMSKKKTKSKPKFSPSDDAFWSDVKKTINKKIK